MPSNSVSKDERQRALKQSELFGGLSDATLKEIVQRTTLAIWPKGRSVTAEDIREELHFIISGRVKIIQINEETGRAVTLFLLGPGDIFDILYLLDGKPGNVLFEASDEVVLLTMPMGAAHHWIMQHPAFNRVFLPYIGKAMRALEDLSGDLALYDTETRLAHLIIRHLDGETHNPLSLINDMSHESLAEMIGSVRTVVNRQLQNWQKQGIISMHNGQITLKKLEILLEKANSLISNHKP